MGHKPKCDHQWVAIGYPQILGFSYDGCKKVSVLCRCSLCGKEEEKIYAGGYVGELLDSWR